MDALSDTQVNGEKMDFFHIKLHSHACRLPGLLLDSQKALRTGGSCWETLAVSVETLEALLL